MDTLLKFEIDEILGTRPGLQDDPENMDDDGKPQLDPVGNFIAKMQLDSLAKSAGMDFDWSTPVTVSASRLFAKGTVGYRLGVVRVEEKIIGDARWSYAYNSAGELVGALEVEE